MKLFLAGTSGYKFLADEIKKSSYILESFWYFKDWQIPFIHGAKDFLLDSGAFTFLNSKSKKNKSFDDYLKKYIAFIKTNNVKHFFELDIDSVVGYKKVLDFREKLETETGKKCIPVWHRQRGEKEYYKLCQEYDYIAIGGLAIKEIKRTEHKFLNTLCAIAKKYDCKVHGLGFTPKTLKDYKFYSCDSTNWSAGWRFAQIFKFEQGMIKSTSNKQKKISDMNIVQHHNLKQWIYFQKYLDYYN